jgi:hypothetical protein
MFDFDKASKETITETTAEVVNEFNGLFNNVIADGNDFVTKQVNMLQRYLIELNNKQITKEQYDSYIQDVIDILEIEKMKVDMEIRITYQKLLKGITDILINKLNGLLK